QKGASNMAICHARYIGRVGALAVALGVGAAIATTPASAWAGPSSGSTSSESDGSSSASSTSSSSSSSSSTSASSASTATPTSASTSTATETPASDSKSATSSTPTSTPSGTVQASGGASTAVGKSSSKETLRAPKSDLPLLAKSNRNSFALPEPTTGPLTEPRLTLPQPSLPIVTALSVKPTTALPTVTSLATTQTSVPTTQAVSVVPQTVSAPAASPLSIVTGFVSDVLSLVGLAPAATNSPAAPVQTPVLWTVLGWVRREIQQMFFGQTALPDQSSQTTTSLAVQNAPTLAVSPLGTPEQLAAEQTAMETVNTLPVQLMKFVL